MHRSQSDAMLAEAKAQADAMIAQATEQANSMVEPGIRAGKLHGSSG